MNRFFIPKEQIGRNSVTISGSDVNHIKNVLRKAVGDELICFDGSGFEYIARIYEIKKDGVLLSIVSETHRESEPHIKVCLGQGLPKHAKMDEIIQRSTELGVTEIAPVLTERSVAKGEKASRWQRIAKESAEQSGRLVVPAVYPLMDLDGFLEFTTLHELKIVPWEGEKERTLKQVLHERTEAASIAVLIGPEGGFSSGEIGKASNAGFTPVSLGKRILRTETAGPAVISMIMYEREQ